MSTDRLERRLPEVLTELSLPRTPAYIDNLLSRTERTPQRPGWTFIERWIPVSTLPATLSGQRQLPLRPLIAVAIVLALVIASIAVYVGSQRRLPPPTGLARNGLVVTNSTSGDMVSVDPATDVTRTLVAGPNLCCADVAPDGQRFAFLRLAEGSGNAIGLAIADVNGTVLRELAPETAQGLEWFDWAPQSDRMLIINRSGVGLVDVATGAITPVEVPFNVDAASWIGTTGDILLTERLSGTGPVGAAFRVHRISPGAASGPVLLTTLQYAINPPLVSPDGSKFMYFIWGPEERLQGRIHVFDFASGEDHAVTSEAVQAPADQTIWENVVWSPDGSVMAAELYTATENHVAIIPAIGGDPFVVGPAFPEMTNGVAIRFSPDGTSLLATYRFDGSTWLLPVSGAEGRQVPWAVGEEIDWQRLAP